MAVSFPPASDFKGKRADNIKRVQIHVAEAQGLSLKGSANSASAYVTVESPGLGTLHQTDNAGKGKKLVWHENTRIVELKPSTPIKFTVRRQAFWPISHNVLGCTDTYDICKLIEMQGKNDRETCVTLTLNQQTEGTGKPSLIVNIRDLDTPHKIQQVREYAAYAASQQSLHRTKGKGRDMDGSASLSDSSPASSRSSDFFPTTPLTATSFSSFSTSSPPSSASASEEFQSSLLLSPMTAEAVAATSAMSAAVASPSGPSSLRRQRSSSRGKSSSIDEIIETAR